MNLNVEKLNESVAMRVAEHLAEHKIGGVEIVVNHNGKRVLTMKAGQRNAAGDPLGEKTMYRIASMTKPVTVTAVMQQVMLGRIDLNAPVSEYLPDYRVMMVGQVEDGKIIIDKPAKNTIRVFNLLCHTSGIDFGPMHQASMQNHPRKTLADTVAYYAKIPLAYEPFERTGYSESAGFDAAARIVELVSGEEYGSYVKKHITDPLEMVDTTFAPTEEQWSRMIYMFRRTDDGQAAEGAVTEGCVFETIPPTCCMAGGGLASTIEDYSKFAEMLRRGGTGENGAEILSPEAIKIMTKPYASEKLMADSDWALGMRVVTKEFPNKLPLGAFGWSGAYGSHFWVDPVNNITAVYMRNARNCGGECYQLEDDVMNAFE